MNDLKAQLCQGKYPSGSVVECSLCESKAPGPIPGGGAINRPLMRWKPRSLKLSWML